MNLGWFATASFFVAGTAVYGYMLWRAPSLLHAVTPQERHNSRILILSVGGAIVVAIGLLYTARNYRLSHRGQVTDRFTKALERLDSDQLNVRIGGIHAIAQVMQDSAQHHDDVVEVLTMFIQEHAPRSKTRSPTEEVTSHGTLAISTSTELPRKPRADVQAALTALANRPVRRERRSIDLGYLHLAGADLSKADLSRAILVGSTLFGARLTLADLTKASLSNADLTEASLQYATLTGASLGEAYYDEGINFGPMVDMDVQCMLRAKYKVPAANLSNADLRCAVLTSASLNGANMKSAVLLYSNLAGAYLQDVDLSGAYMEGVNLKKANLMGANLTRAFLKDATMNRANLFGARTADAVVNGALGLDNLRTGAVRFACGRLGRTRMIYERLTWRELQPVELKFQQDVGDTLQ